MKNFSTRILILTVLIGGTILGVRYYNSAFTEEVEVQKIVEKVHSSGGGVDQPLTLIFVFTPEDCFICLKEIDFMSNYCKNNKELQCYGLVNHPHRTLVLDFVKNSGWEFPVFVDENIPEPSDVGFPCTPYKLVINSDQELLFAEGALTEWKTEGQLKTFLSNNLNN